MYIYFKSIKVAQFVLEFLTICRLVRKDPDKSLHVEFCPLLMNTIDQLGPLKVSAVFIPIVSLWFFADVWPLHPGTWGVRQRRGCSSEGERAEEINGREKPVPGPAGVQGPLRQVPQ